MFCLCFRRKNLYDRSARIWCSLYLDRANFSRWIKTRDERSEFGELLYATSNVYLVHCFQLTRKSLSDRLSLAYHYGSRLKRDKSRYFAPRLAAFRECHVRGRRSFNRVIAKFLFFFFPSKKEAIRVVDLLLRKASSSSPVFSPISLVCSFA